MHKIKRTFLIFLLSKASFLVSCALCLSLPKNAEKPFFIDENTEYIEESAAFLALKESMLISNNTTPPLDNNK